MNFPCPEKIVCPGTDFPLSNFSSEAPDLLTFDALGYPVFDPNNPIGGTDTTGPFPVWFADACLSLCNSFLTLEDALLCAQRLAFICAHTPPSGPPPTFFFSSSAFCSLPCPDGSSFTWRVPAGAFVDVSQIAADNKAAAYACDQAALHIMCLSAIQSACVGQLYSQAITCSGGATPLTYQIVSGSLPPGMFLTQNQTTAFINGTCNIVGSYTFTLQVTDRVGNETQKSYTLGVMGITNLASIPAGQTGIAYSFQLIAGGGTAPYSFALSSGALPAGLGLSSSGLISGTPTVAGTSAFVIAVTDSTP